MLTTAEPRAEAGMARPSWHQPPAQPAVGSDGSTAGAGGGDLAGWPPRVTGLLGKGTNVDTGSYTPTRDGEVTICFQTEPPSVSSGPAPQAAIRQLTPGPESKQPCLLDPVQACVTTPSPGRWILSRGSSPSSPPLSPGLVHKTSPHTSTDCCASCSLTPG